MVKQAAAQANKELGLLDDKRANAIIQAAKEVQEGKWDKEFVVDVFQAGAGVSFHMNSNEVIANRAVEILGGTLGDYSIVHPNDHVNYGQSTNDVFPTGMRLATLLELEELYPVLDSLISALEKKGKEFHEFLKSGRTHMQDAVPMRLGQEFAAYAGAIRRAKEATRIAADSLRELGLGGSAVGTGINTHPDYREKVIQNLSRISGQKLVPVDDMRYAMQSNFAMANVSSALRNLALEIIRISNDLRLLSSGPNTGLAEINLPALQPGSSIMPGKINPVIPDGRAGWATRVECDDAHHVIQRAAVDHHPFEHAAPVHHEMRGRHHRQPEPLRVLCAGNGLIGDGVEPVYRLCQSSGDRERSCGQRTLHHRDRP